ncbi:MAG TPA: oxidoreductase, partial [Anaeromyxobacteraceae bacterium]|nr:oxidoreductase [Anaeromyxobacteraceae bacterium]
PGSRIFYNLVKGEIEQAVARLAFTSVYAFRPSMLDGEREESRPGERVGLVVMRVLAPILGKYRPTPVEALAAAMIASAKAAAPGVHVVEADAMLRMHADR